MIVKNWIDTHAHFYPEESQEVRENRLSAMKVLGWQTKTPPTWDPETTLGYMDRTGIAMQILSNIPKALSALKASNDYGASLVKKYPKRFGLFVALPTNDVVASLEEIARSDRELNGDGFAVTCHYNEVYLSDPKLDPVWAELDRRRATVFAHPDAYSPTALGNRPSAVIEVAFETARTFVDMLYAGVFRRFPNIRFIVAHCGGTLPVLSGRLDTLGTEPWVPNPNNITREEMTKQLASLYLDTAAVCPHCLDPALRMTTANHLVYGSDCGVPCSTDETMNANLKHLLDFQGMTKEQIQEVGRNALRLLPKAARRLSE